MTINDLLTIYHKCQDCKLFSEYLCQDCNLFSEYLLELNRCPSCGSKNTLMLMRGRYGVISPLCVIKRRETYKIQRSIRARYNSLSILDIENLDWSNLDAVDKFIFNNRHNSGNDKSSVLFRETLERAIKEAVLNSHESLAETLILTLKKRAMDYPELIGYAQHVAIHNKQMERVIYNTLRECINEGIVHSSTPKSTIKLASKKGKFRKIREYWLKLTSKKRRLRKINIKSREYWCTYEYWALIDKNSYNNSCTIFFIYKRFYNGEAPTSVIFDKLKFDCIENAIEGLRRNQFLKVDEYLKVDEFREMYLSNPPTPPFIDIGFPNLYSKQDGLWKYE